MSQKSTKTAAELESIVAAELREHSACDSAGVVPVRPMGLSWDAALVGDGQDSIVNATRGSRKSPLGFAESSIWLISGSTEEPISNRAGHA
jgi:hypothetical protein